MRNANERTLVSGIYTRLREVRMNSTDRQNAVNAMEKAERLVGMYLWLKEKLAGIGHLFLKPGLKH